MRGVSPGGRRKLEHALGAIVLASTERVYLPEGDPAFPLDDVLAELTRFTGDPDQDASDDIVDTFSYCAELLPMIAPAGGSGPPGLWKPSGRS